MPLFARNVALEPYRPMSAWRKIAVGTWVAPRESNIHARIEVDATAILARVDALAAEGARVTPLSFLVKAVGDALREHPDTNVLLRLGRIYRRVDANVFVSVLVGEDLTGLLVRQCDAKSVREIGEEIRAGSKRLRSGEDRELEDMKRTLNRLPGAIMHSVLQALSFVLYTLNVWTPLLGMSKDPLGSAQVTFLGGIDLEEAWGPLDPYARIPLMVAGGAIRSRPWVVGAEVVARPIMPVCFTVDHRVIDGLGVARFLASVRASLEGGGPPDGGAAGASPGDQSV